MSKATIINQINDQGLSKFMLKRSEFEGNLLKMVSIHQLCQSISKRKGALVRVSARVRKLSESI